MMEVESRAGEEGGPPPLSPQGSSSPSNKVVEEDDSLGYTITMNECDEESNNSSTSRSRTATPTADQEASDDKGKQRPPKLKAQKVVENGDDTVKEGVPDSQSSKGKQKSDSSKESAGSDKTPQKSEMNGTGQSVEKQDKDVDGEKEDVSKTENDDGASYGRRLRKRPSRGQKYVEKEEIEAAEGSEDEKQEKVKTPKKIDKKPDGKSEKKEDVKKMASKREKREEDVGKKKESENCIDEVIIDSDDDEEDSKDESNKKEDRQSSGKASGKDGTSNSQSPAEKSASTSTKQALAEKISNSIIVDARTGVTLPYVPPSNAASLLNPSSGVRYVIPPGANPGSVMYIPSSNSFVASTNSVFPTTASIVSMPAGTSAPILIPPINASTPAVTNTSSYFIPSSGSTVAGVVRPPFKNTPLTPVPTFENSSKGMIEMLKWESANHINIKPKYVKPNPKAELGNLAKWLFDLGSDIVKESVYHDLVRLHRQRKDMGNLTDKEKADFAKLQEIDEELNKKVGHLKFKLTKSCKCGFMCDLESVLYLHKEYAHHDRGGYLNCSLCKYTTRQPSAFKFHMEAEHNMMGRMENRPSFFECQLCPYESNYPNRMEQHKVRCLKQFRENFNMHPSCLTGPEISLCLENVFYFVFTRQFLNTIAPPVTGTAASAVPASYKDIKPKNMPLNLASGRPGSASTFGPQANMGFPQQKNKQLASQFAPLAASAAGMSRSFPVISSQIGGKGAAGSKAQSYVAATRQPPTTVPPQPNAQSGPSNAFEVCEICGGYVKDRKALRIHFFYAHRIDMPFGVFERTQPPLYCATCFARFWTAQGLQKHIEVHKADMSGASTGGNGVAGKCISCGHRVPNILMHMRMVHNRELRHYLAALMCIFCGNRFQSKREVENHMSAQHGVVVKNSAAQGGPLGQGVISSPTIAPKPPVSHKPGPASKTGKLNRGSQCVLCNITFTRNVDLTRHCMRVHHTCMKCGLVVVDKESLNRHTCLHSAAGMRTCQICSEKGFHPAYYIKHMRDKHLRRCSIVLRRMDKEAVESYDRPITISDSDDDEPLKPSSPKRQKREDTDPSPKAHTSKDKEGEEKSATQPRRRQVARRSKKFTVPKTESDSDYENCDTKPKQKVDERKNVDIPPESAETLEEFDREDRNEDNEKTASRTVESETNEKKTGKADASSKHDTDRSEKARGSKNEANENEGEKAGSSVTEAQKTPEKSSEKERSGKTETVKAEKKSGKTCNKPEDEKSEKKPDKSGSGKSEVNKNEKKNDRSGSSSKTVASKQDDSEKKIEKGGSTSSSKAEKRKSDENKDADSKKTPERKRKATESSEEDEDDESYSKRLRRSSRGNGDALELD